MVTRPRLWECVKGNLPAQVLGRKSNLGRKVASSGELQGETGHFQP